MKPKISIVTLGVRDFDRAFRFYKDGLGFKPHDYQEGSHFVIFEMEGTWLALYPREDLAAEVSVPAEGSGFPGITLAHNVASEAMVDEVYHFIIAAGARPVSEPKPMFWGGYSGYFADPDGYYWEVAYNPAFDLT